MNRLANFVLLAGVGILSGCGGGDAGTTQTTISNNSITALCVSYGDERAFCECATEKFRASNEDADTYAAIAARFLADTENGRSIADRWQDAVDVVLADYSSKTTGLERTTDRLKLSNALGRAHREAIKSCSSKQAVTDITTNPRSADKSAAVADQTDSNPAVAASALQVSRTREGNGGIIAVAGQMTMEFDYSPPQGYCRLSDGKLAAKGIAIDNDKAGVTINYDTIIAPDTGRVVNHLLILEVRKDGYVPWVTHVGTGIAGSVDDMSLDVSTDGATTLSVTGIIAGFEKNRAPTGIKAPFRLEAICGL
jgi:hypothetical protein